MFSTIFEVYFIIMPHRAPVNIPKNGGYTRGEVVAGRRVQVARPTLPRILYIQM